MPLTANDLNEIRNIVDSSLMKQSDEVIKPIQDEVQALRSDIEEIYNMLSDLRHSAITDRKFSRLSLEQKILTLNAELVSAARQAGIDLLR